LVLGVSWRTKHYLVHTEQSGVPNRSLLQATRRPRIARPTVALAIVGSPNSPVNYSHTPLLFPESSQFTAGQPGAPDSPVCQTELVLAAHSQLFSLFFSSSSVTISSTWITMLVYKTIYQV
jgi:hypothetical protein